MWAGCNIERFHLQGRSMGIIGCGDISAEVSRKCSVGFGMDVFVYDPFISELPSTIGPAKQLKSLDEMLPLANFISVHAELNDLTNKKGGSFIS
ncbi:MAG: NAD(P)-dependent oxidoreductase [Pseudomonadota bacterium]|nr:NAD(P)-dependent oxidoreductase [Pseudomonadota bacterium]